MEHHKDITIGIFGGGQLAKMSAQAAQRLGYAVHIYETSPDPPALSVTPFHTIAPLNDNSALTAFAAQCSVITLENEFIDPAILRFCEALNTPVFPTPHTVERVQDKWVQKATLQQAGLPVPYFAKVQSIREAEEFGGRFGYPFLLKSRKGGYDGYGNRTVHSVSELQRGFEELQGNTNPLMAEAFVVFNQELAVMVARNHHRESVVYPVVETFQENHVCKMVKAPAVFEEAFLWGASDLARAAIEAIDGIGIFGVELFHTKDHRLLINELAPRPHNSGHYTIEASVTSQFENHIRAIMNLPLGSAAMRVPAAVMINLLGKRNGEISRQTLSDALSIKNATIHIYGKKETRIRRKLGHVTVTGLSFEDCVASAEKAESLLIL